MNADIAFVNGVVYSVTMDGKRIGGTAVAVSGDKILKVGSDAEINNYIGKATKVIDCKGNTILPGLSDAHCHPSWTASIIAACDLTGVKMQVGQPCDEVIDILKQRLKKYIDENPNDEIIRGSGWDWSFFNGSYGEVRPPNRHDLDEVCKDKPIILESYCQHNIWVNTKAIELAGITAETPTPESGNIEREEDGYPSGLFQEMSAIMMIRHGVPNYDYSVEEYKEILLEYQRSLAHFYGVTMVTDCLHGDNAAEAYKQLAEEGKLKIWTRGVYHINPENIEEGLERLQNRWEKGDEYDIFAIQTIKIFIDGEMAMCEPWEKGITEALGLPESYGGTPLWTLEQAKFVIDKAISLGYRLHIHAMGDLAVKIAVEALEYAQNKNPGDHRNAIAHVMAVKPEDIIKMGKQKIICAMQPCWMVNERTVDGFYVPFYGLERSMNFYPNKQLTDAGCIVTYGTDFPVTNPPNPFHEIHCALTRMVHKDSRDYPEYDGKVLGPPGDEKRDCVTLDEAIRCLTITGAYQNRLENIAGSLEEGKFADVVVIDRNLEKTPIDEIYDIKVHVTLFRGEIVYQAP